MLQVPKLMDRRAGILLHLSSLPDGPYLGDMGPGAYRFVDWLHGAGQSWWQMLPIGPVGDGYSPYSSQSSFAGDPQFISPEMLIRAGWLTKAQARVEKGPSVAGTKADFKRGQAYREKLLRLAFAKAAPDLDSMESLRDFRARERFWLRDFALFTALSKRYGTRIWTQWPDDIRDRTPEGMERAERELAAEIAFHEFAQFIFDQEWQALRSYAAEKGIGLIGDLPIFVSHASADVWAHRQFFCLDKNGHPTVVAGCPPDAFNADGQLWGNALYDWDQLAQAEFGWWVERLRRSLSQFDTLRLDHFIGFHRYWEIDAKAKTARKGVWRPVPGEAFFKTVEAKLGSIPMIAEDLGAVVPPVRALRDAFGFPGMKVLQFAFDGSVEAAEHKPHLAPPNAVIYPGTHDNDTAVGWYQTLQKRASRDKKARLELELAQAYLGPSTTRQVAQAMIRSVYASPAHTAIVAMQDILGQGTPSRMNVPGVAQGNWRYRIKRDDLTKPKQLWLKNLAVVYDRCSF